MIHISHDEAQPKLIRRFLFSNFLLIINSKTTTLMKSCFFFAKNLVRSENEGARNMKKSSKYTTFKTTISTLHSGHTYLKADSL